MKRRVTCNAGVMAVDGRRYALNDYRKLMLVSIGKAAGTMTAAFLRIVGSSAARLQGVLAGICEDRLPEQVQVFAGGHPEPNQASLDAAVAILQLLEHVGDGDLVVFLVSGGGSSMVEEMLRGDISLEDTAATHKALVESGAPIAAINAVRKHLSAVKGGRLAAAAAQAEQLTIFVSDVPIGELDALASGPTLPDRSSVEDVLRIVAEYRLTASVPPRVVDLLGPEMAETPKPGDASFAKSQWTILLDSASLEEAASARAAELGWNVTIDNTCDDWDTEDAAKYLVRRLSELRQGQERVCLLSAGEITVRVPAGTSGQGGRNQHFVLMCSQQIAGSDCVVLSAGSDGVDGNSSAAGAIADGTTVARADAADRSVEKALTGFDSYGLLSMLGDAIVTGPTGNNLRDLRILLAP